jgi:hypothetical protein
MCGCHNILRESYGVEHKKIDGSFLSNIGCPVSAAWKNLQQDCIAGKTG